MLSTILIFTCAVVIFVLYSGGALNKISIPGLFEADFASPAKVTAVPEAARDFVLGQWQLQINPQGSDVSSGTSITYYDDGTLTGAGTQFVNNQGIQIPVTGTWSFEKLADHEFRLNATINGQAYSSRFLIFDANHIENEDQNYVAVRIP